MGEWVDRGKHTVAGNQALYRTGEDGSRDSSGDGMGALLCLRWFGLTGGDFNGS